MGVAMTEASVQNMLTRAHTGVLVSLRSSGEPVALPVWFVAREGAIFVRTPARAKKVARIRADERVSFLVQDGLAWRELRGIHISGAARVVDDRDVIAAVGAAIDEKYAAFRTAPAARSQATNAHYAERVVIHVSPTSVISWDNGLLAGESRPGR